MKKVVSATLAGALAVGMVPAMALADDAIELQAEIADDVAQGKISAANDEDGKGLNLGSALKFTLNDNTPVAPTYVVPTEITTYTGEVIDLTDPAVKADYRIAYYKVSKTGAYNADKSFAWAGTDRFDTVVGPTQDPAAHVWTAGDYYVGVWHKSADGYKAVAVKFTVEADSLAGAHLYEFDNAAADKGVSDKTFNYTGSDLRSSLKLTLGTAHNDLEGDYEALTFFQKGADGNYVPVTSDGVTNAGEYAAKVVGKNEYKDYEGMLYFTVGALNLADASVEFSGSLDSKVASSSEKASAITTSSITLNGKTVPGDIVLKFNDGLVPSETTLAPGSYTYTLYAPQVPNGLGGLMDNPNVTGAKTLNVVRYEKGVEFKYDGGTDFDLTDNTPAVKFDADEISVTDGAAVDPQKVPYTVTYKKEVTTDVWKDASDITSPGTYKAIVTVNDPNYEFGGKKEIKFSVAATQLTDANVFVTYKNALVTTGAIATDINYTGADVLDAVSVEVLDKAGKALAEGTDYVIEVKNAATDKAVDEIVNAGSYTLTIKPATDSKYAFTPIVKTVSIVAAPVQAKILDQVEDGDAASVKAIYTGDVIDPIVKFDAKFDLNADGNDYNDVDYNGKDVLAVPGSAYSVVIKSYEDKAGKKATPSTMPKAIEAVGTYEFQIVPAEGNVNFAFENTVYKMVVTDQNVFPDVPAAKWFADEVYKIATYKVLPKGETDPDKAVAPMGGYANGLFGPYDSMKRGDMALVLARAAGIAKPMGTADDGTLGGAWADIVDTPFADVKGNEYYAWAIDAMAEAGIMGGYTDGSGEFGAQDTLTREQVATVLYRFDGVYGGEASILASALDGYKDGAEVSKFAVPAMEWAIGEGLFGVDTDYLNPGADITRAELAAVLVRYLGL